MGLGCSKSSADNSVDDDTVISKIDKDGKAVSYNQKYDGFTDVTVVDLSKSTQKNPITIDLSKFSDKDVMIDFSLDMKIVDKTSNQKQITWIVNEVDAKFPQLFKGKVNTNEWTSIKSSLFVHLGQNRQIYLSGAGLGKENTMIYIKNLKIQFSGDGIGDQISQTWMEAPSLKETYKGLFDYIGLAVDYNAQNNTGMANKNVQKGVAYHADYLTAGNHFKPDFVLGWNKPTSFDDFDGEDEYIYEMPALIPTFRDVDKNLKICKENGLKMRGHVLVWHSQTPHWFFLEEWGMGGNEEYVSVGEMNARMEWYIKTMMEHVAEWEKKNNNGEHIITVWDVVNEAASDNASDSQYLRTDSDWYRVYGNDDFIVNAFRYANKYAPKDVKLVYNDYNCYQPAKLKAICKIIDSIQKNPETRIDAVGMQSHVQVKYPKITGKDSYETAVQTFISKGLNVQVTELDIANAKENYNPYILKSVYKDYFTMFLNNRKTDSKKGIEGVTIWGLEDDTTWLNSQSQYKGYTQYPLLFTTNKYICKPAFYGVIEAAEEFKKK